MKRTILTIVLICLFSQSIHATVFGDTYDTSTPAGTDSPTEADDRIRETKGAVQERENVDHYWPFTGTEVSDADAGEHRKVLFHAPIAATPTVAENHGDLRIKDVGGKAEFHWTDEDEQEVQITSVGKLGSVTTDLTVNDAIIGGTLDVTGLTELIGVATIADASVTKTSAAPTTDAMIVNKKYVDDQMQSSQVLGSTNTSNSSGAFADLAGMTKTITTTGGNVLILFSGPIQGAATADDAQFRVDIDGSPAGGWAEENMGSGISKTISFQWLATGLSAASHTFKIQWRDATGTIFSEGSTIGPRVLTVIEMPN